MANQALLGITLKLLGDGSSTTATIILDSTPLRTNSDSVINYSPSPDSVTSPIVADAQGQNIPATAILSKNGKQVLVTLSAAFTGVITVTMNLGYNV